MQREQHSKPLYADIAFPSPVRELFTYAVPKHLANILKPGMRAWVPLQNRISIGMVIKLHGQKPDFETKDVREILDQEPVLGSDLLSLTSWMSKFYFCGPGEAVQAALPSGLNFSSQTKIRIVDADTKLVSLTKEEQKLLDELLLTGDYLYKEALSRWNKAGPLIRSLVKKGLAELWEVPMLDMKPKIIRVWDWVKKPVKPSLPSEEKTDDGSEEIKMHKWQIVWEALNENSALLPATTSRLTDEIPECSPYALKRLEKEGVLCQKETEQGLAEPPYPFKPESLSALNAEQEQVVGKIRQSMENEHFCSHLLYGITGSGKTEVYIHALKLALDKGKSALVLVPEIALTPQTVRRFYLVFGSQIAILHSRLNERERYEAWQALRKGEKKIVIGARSAVFAPLKNPGIIIIDEEHDSSYYQADPAPRYHAREVAMMRAYAASAPVVLGSATPGLSSLVASARKNGSLLRLGARHSGATLPEVHLIHLTEYKHAMKGPLAMPLYNAIEEAVQRGEQAILLYNRRGFAGYMQCDDCGEVVECPHCSVSLTYHRTLQHLRCHYCGYTSGVPYTCPSCDSHELQMLGSGTQQVEQGLESLFPEFRILRMDQDTTSRKNAHDEMLSAFGRREYDIMIGTQLVAKGLDFANVTVVGVINADTELAFPSYRSNERMFQLLSQVAGRSGRAGKKGVVYLQTRQPEHFAIQFAKKHDYEGFARHELALRKSLLYPPYSRLLTVQLKAKDGDLCRRAAEVFARVMRDAQTPYPVLGPGPDVIERLKDEFRWVITMKLPSDIKTKRLENLCTHFMKWYDTYKPDGASGVRVTISHEMM
ncbi:MAG: primosomal protein N' [Balneolales bacterium]|nr:primosomal protein N' [Balneolales bacterium]